MESLRADDPGQVGPYRLLSRLGAGGMGVVYLGRSRGGRLVAVKVIRQGFTGEPRYRARFRREVAAARKVTGTFTAPVLDADPEAASPWLVTAYLPGPSLQEAVRSFGAMPVDAVRALAVGLAEAIAAIHDAGVVHRDLKPANVILTAGGPRVIDFGIARPEDGTAITRAGAPIGTPGFMSPEQVKGGDVGPASDIFTLGAMLAYAASGAEPFGTGPMRSKLYRVMTVQAELGGVPEGALRELILACLAPLPEHRPTAPDVLERLGSWDGDEVSLQGTGWLPVPVAEEIDRRTATASPPPDEPEAVAPTPVRGPSRRVLIAGAGTAVLATAGGLGALLWDRPDDKRPAGAAPSRSATVATPRPVPRWKRKVSDYYPELLAADGVVLARTENDVSALDAASGKVLWKRGVRGVAAAGDTVYLVGAEDAPVVHAVRAASGKSLWTYKPPFSELPFPGPVVAGSVVCFGDGPVKALGRDDGEVRWSAKVSVENGLAADAGHIAGVDDRVLTAFGARDGRTRWTYAMDQGTDVAIGGGMVFSCDRRGTLHAVRADDGKRAWQRPGSGAGSFMQVGGGIVYTAVGNGDVLALDAATGRTVWSRRLGGAEASRYGRGNTLGLSGGTLYVGCTDRNVYALDAASGRVLWSHGADVTLGSGPVSAGALAFIGTRDGHVHALAPPAAGGTHAAP
ncbi:PQQ-binding-like beta-propeller repeat protein [Actinomadura sp. 9N407]|uniref:outer membrane protein assembly factor BamB family protein n=1 Tax=Actinomadura sp. 9N407 TaxID=3375154 RepID=UPI0037A967FE